MFLPYKKYKCGGCDKWHRVGLRQWYEIIKETGHYIQVQANASNIDTALNRAEEKFKGFEIERRNMWYVRFGKWLMK